MPMKKLLFTSFLFISSLLGIEIPEKDMVIIVPSYNNEIWVENNLRSIIGQNYKNFRIIYINDCSSDSTQRAIETWRKKFKLLTFSSFTFDELEGETIQATVDRFKHEIFSKKTFFTLINNKKRCGALENLYRAIQSCGDHEIIVLVDGDDWLYHENVLQMLNSIYSSNEAWMTHGTLTEYPRNDEPWNEPIPEDLIEQNSIRQLRCPSHLRTFYAWLFKKIALQDLMIDGKFFPMTWDMGIMFPMAEMAGRHCFFVDKINYVYNQANPINDNKVNKKLQQELDVHIRALPPYKPIEHNEKYTGHVSKSGFSAAPKPRG